MFNNMECKHLTDFNCYTRNLSNFKESFMKYGRNIRIFTAAELQKFSTTSSEKELLQFLLEYGAPYISIKPMEPFPSFYI